MRAIAIIPARGGSKRLPRKNILPLGGKPMLAHPVAAARAAKIFDLVVVSSDDPEILDCAAAAGAVPVARPADLATDTIHELVACRHVLDTLADQQQHFDVLCVLYACAAFIGPQDLVDACAAFSRQPEARCLLGVSAFPIHPFKALVAGTDGYSTLLHPEGRQPSQTYPECVGSNGTFYWLHTADVRADRVEIYGDRLLTHTLPLERAVDIDTVEDYQRAKALYAFYHQQGSDA